MINLLPPEQKNSVEKEYMFRLGTAYILLMFIAVVVGIALLLPSYFFVDIKEEFAQSELEELRNSSEITQREEIREELLLTKEYLRILTSDAAREPIYAVIDRISKASGGDVEIFTFSYSRANEGDSSTLSVGGVAPTRDKLLQFKKALDSDELFEEIVLPVSSLAEDTDIKFTIQIKGIF